MVCKCGYQNDSGEKYCSACGRKLRKKKPIRRERNLLIVLSLVLVLAIGGVACWKLIFADRGENRPTGEETEPVTTEESVPDTSTVQADEQLPQGWSGEGDVFRYYLDGKAVTGIYKITEPGQIDQREFPAGYYFFDQTGAMCIGWQEYAGDDTFQAGTYYFTEEGPAVAPGWYSDTTGWYCFNECGRLYRDEEVPEEGGKIVVDENGYAVQAVRFQVPCSTHMGDLLMHLGLSYLVPEGKLPGCTSVSVRIEMDTLLEKSSSAMWIIYVCSDGVWQDMQGNCEVVVQNGLVLINFAYPVNLDAIMVRPLRSDVLPEEMLYDVTLQLN